MRVLRPLRDDLLFFGDIVFYEADRAKKPRSKGINQVVYPLKPRFFVIGDDFYGRNGLGENWLGHFLAFSYGHLRHQHLRNGLIHERVDLVH